MGFLHSSTELPFCQNNRKFINYIQVKNINADYNITLQNNCKALNDYVKYIDRIKTNLKNNIILADAIEEALDWAINQELLEGFFRRQRAEVMAVSLTEFDQNLHNKWIRHEGYEEGQLAKAVEAAENFLKEDIAPEVIARCTGLTLEKVLELQKEISVHA